MDAVRRAGLTDAAELTRLRAQMFDDMGRDTAAFDELWWQRNIDRFSTRLAQPEHFAAFVIDKPDSGLAACAVGWLDEHLIGAANPLGRVGHIASTCTDPVFRRRGYGQATLTALIAWLRSTGVPSVSLHATLAGERLYRSLGFADPENPYLTLRLQ